MKLKINCLVLISFCGFFFACKNDTESQLNDWKKKYQSSPLQSQSLDELARIAFHHSYRESKWDHESETLTIEYGGSSALTFSDSNRYVPMTQLDLSRKASRVYFYARGLGLKNLRVSLVKPFYVKNSSNTDTEIQEFEVYRVKITPETWQSALSLGDFSLFEVDKNDYPEGRFLKALEILIQNWEEELNEFFRIEVK